MTVEWIEPIFDRTYYDVIQVMNNPSIENPKGCYNYIDLNRIGNNTRYVMEDMLERRIIRHAPSLQIRTNWTMTDIPTREDIQTMIQNIILLQTLSNPIIANDLKTIYPATQMTYTLANDIEYNLNVMKNQPNLPIQMFLLTIENGIIPEYNTNMEYFAEDDVITIRGVPYGDNAQYMVFDHWSGDTDDLQYVTDVNSQETTFTMPYKDVTLTAVFKVRFPRTLTLTNAIIYDEIGGSERQFFAGDQILILANVASAGKRFYEWQGTQDGLDNLTGGSQPSTAWLTMPDCDVELHPLYINAGKHYVTVNNGEGSGWYDYGEYVYISPNTPTKREFSYWSGDTSYLDNINYSYQSFKMPDINISFTANFTYQYSYNNVEVINGTIDGETSAIGLRELSTHTLAYDEPPSGQGFDYWQLQGYGSISGNTFTVGDGDATITAHYNYLRTLKVNNINNDGQYVEYSILQSRSRTISTSSTVGNYHFRRWEENGTTLSTSNSINITMGDNNREITAIYEYVEPSPKVYYNVTVVNRNNAGGTETVTVEVGTKFTRSTTEEVGDKLFQNWSKNGSNVSSSTSYSFYVYENTTLECVYRDKETYQLTVVNGTISGGTTSGYYKEREAVTIIADNPVDGYVFTGWSSSGNVYSVGSSSTTTVKLGRGDGVVTAMYSNTHTLKVVTNSGTSNYTVKEGYTQNINGGTPPSGYEWDKWVLTSGDGSFGNYLLYSTYYRMNRENSEVTATYKLIPYFTITVINGKVNGVQSGTFIRNSSPTIVMDPAPEGHQFLQWEVLEGTDNDVYQPLAETTNIRNLTHNITVRATYYIPNPEIQYTLTVENKDGSTRMSNHSIGEQVNIYADYPDEGYEFYKWNGDTQYVLDKYSSNTIVNMPGKDIYLSPVYKREGYTTLYHLVLHGGECEIGENDWDIEGEFEEGDVVNIRAVDIPIGYNFNGWKGTTESMSTVTDLNETETTVTISNFDIDLTRDVIEEGKYSVSVINGETSGTYYPNSPVAIYFNMENDNNTHYTFTRWVSDDLAYIQLFDGGQFDVNVAGDADNSQIIKMPERNITLTAEYTISHYLTISGGTVNSQTSGYYPNGDRLTLIADTKQGYTFSHWEGDTSCLSSIYGTTTIITMPNTPISIRAVFVLTSDNNDIGYVLTDMYNNDNINIENINIISGSIRNGFIITDINGHIYSITNVNNNIATIFRLTQIKGGSDNE